MAETLKLEAGIVRIFDHIRQRLLEKAGVVPDQSAQRMAALFKSEWVPWVEQAMRNRLVMGALRYGPIGTGKRSTYSRLSGVMKRIDQYKRTGNTECLIDACNLLMLEANEPTHPRAHFSALEEDHSCQ